MLYQDISNSGFIVYTQFLQNLKKFHPLGIANLQVQFAWLLLL